MTTAVQSLLTEFDRLSDSEKRDATREILRRTALCDSPSLSDEELTAIADETFLEMDRHEATS